MTTVVEITLQPLANFTNRFNNGYADHAGRVVRAGSKRSKVRSVVGSALPIS